MYRPIALSVMALTAVILPAAAQQIDYRLLATTRTSTMEKEMNQAAEAGYEYRASMGGESAFGGKEVLVVMAKSAGQSQSLKRYKLLATRKTSTMQKELNAAAQEGFLYRGQTIFESTFGGREVAVILERDASSPARETYKLLATSRTSTMEKELRQAGQEGFVLAGMTVGETSFGGNEVLCILKKPAPEN